MKYQIIIYFQVLKSILKILIGFNLAFWGERGEGRRLQKRDKERGEFAKDPKRANPHD